MTQGLAFGLGGLDESDRALARNIGGRLADIYLRDGLPDAALDALARAYPAFDCKKVALGDQSGFALSFAGVQAQLAGHQGEGTVPARDLPDLSDRMDPIFQCSPPRTGSTLVWQILRHLFGWRVFKTHHPIVVNAPVVMTLRDPRDSVVSGWRLRTPDAVDGRTGRTRRMTSVEIEDAIGTAQAEFRMRNAQLAAYAGSHRLLLISYEEMVHAGGRVVEDIAGFFGLTIPAAEKMRILGAHSLERNRAHADAVDTSDGYSRENALLVRHVWMGRSGTWKQVVPVDHHRQFDDALAPIARFWARLVKAEETERAMLLDHAAEVSSGGQHLQLLSGGNHPTTLRK